MSFILIFVTIKITQFYNTLHDFPPPNDVCNPHILELLLQIYLITTTTLLPLLAHWLANLLFDNQCDHLLVEYWDDGQQSIIIQTGIYYHLIPMWYLISVN